MKLVENLKKLRKERHITQEELSIALEISLRTYGRYESGEREPNASILWRMADFYGVTTDYLIGRTDTK